MPDYIYTLSDPRKPTAIMYVGYTRRSLKQRFSQHLAEARSGKSSYKCNWIRKLLAEGIEPVILMLEKVDRDNWQEREKFWIAFYKPTLTNLTLGGEGCTGLRSMTNGKEVRLIANHETIPDGWVLGIKLEPNSLSKKSMDCDQPGSLMLRTIDLLSRADMEEVSLKTGFTVNWLRKFKYRVFLNPSVNRVQALYEYLTGTKLIKG